MKTIKQPALLATATAMILIGLATHEAWIRLAAVVIFAAAAFIFVKSNLKNK